MFEDHDRARDEQAAARAREGRRAFEEAQRQAPQPQVQVNCAHCGGSGSIYVGFESQRLESCWRCGGTGKWPRYRYPGDSSGGLGCLPKLIVLCVLAVIAGTIIGHHIYDPKNAQTNAPGGQLNYQETTLDKGLVYDIYGSNDLYPVDDTASGYFVRVNDSGLSFADNVHVIAVPTSATKDTDPCVGLALPKRSGPRVLPWAKLKHGTRLCAQTQEVIPPDAFDYVITIGGWAGQKLNVSFTAWTGERN